MNSQKHTNILTARDIHKSFGQRQARVDVLTGLDLDVRQGEFLAIMGPSGCGKTTLLQILGLLSPADKGTVIVGDSKPATNERARNALRRTHMGFVFQRFNLLSVLSAHDNVEISLKVRGVKSNGQIARLFESLGISHVARRKPSQMSIGEQQRVAIARALAHQPKVLLADEPTGSLDTANSTALLELLSRTNRELKQTIVMITHSPAAAEFADRVVHMKDGILVDDNN